MRMRTTWSNLKSGEMSAVLPLPPLQYIEHHFDPNRILAFNRRTWTVCLYATALYLALVFQGRRWMRNRKPYSLKKPLILWNIGLAVFSIIGTITVAPTVLCSLYNYGIDYTVCFSVAATVPRVAIWCYMFGLSKLVELGDTAFIVLRKSPLPFLHWYHHVTVLIYTMYGINNPKRSRRHLQCHELLRPLCDVLILCLSCSGSAHPSLDGPGNHYLTAISDVHWSLRHSACFL